MSRQQFSSSNSEVKIFSFQKSGATASFDPTVSFPSSKRVSWRLDNGSSITQVAGNSLVYTGFTSDNSLRNIEIRANSFKNITELTMNNDNLYGHIDLTKFNGLWNNGGSINFSNNPSLTAITNPSINLSFASYNLFSSNIIGNLDMTPISSTIGSFNVNNNPSLTGITFNTATTVGSQFIAQNCNLIGNLNVNTTGALSVFNVSTNTNLTQIIHNPIGSTISNYQAHGCNLIGHHDMSMISGLSFCWLWSNPALTGVTHGYSNANFIQYWVGICNLTGNHDLTMFPNLGGYFNVRGNNNLTGITHTASTHVFTNYIAGIGLVGNLDLSMLSGLGGRIEVGVNSNLTGVTLPISTQPIQGFEIPACNIIGTLDLSGFSSLGSISSATTYPFKFHTNPNLNNILFPIGSGYLRNEANNASNATMGMYSCDLGYVDFKPLSGCTLLSGATVGAPRFELFDNSMTTADVNQVLSDFDLISTLNYSGWTATSGTTGGYINISLNSAPDGSSGGFNGTGATVNLVSKGWTVITD